MVIENLQITPLMEWVLGAGWQDGLLWQPLGMTLLLVLLIVGPAAAVIVLRRSSVVPGPTASGVAGCVCGLLSLLVLAPAAFCSTTVTRNLLLDRFANPIFVRLKPLLGEGWTDGAVYTWLAVVAALFALVYAVCWLAATLDSGPGQGTRNCGRVVLEIFGDIARISVRRVSALAWLAVRESVRRRVVAVFVVFVVIILVAALFINKGSLHPSHLYITVVLNSTVGLTILLALVLSTLSLPTDIRDRTLHTVVTKPVRKIEIVLGRIAGFTFVGTLLLLAIGAISYVFTVNGLNHRHVLKPHMLEKETPPGGKGVVLRGETDLDRDRNPVLVHGHNHKVAVHVAPEHSHALTAGMLQGEPGAGGEVLRGKTGSEQNHEHEAAVDPSGKVALQVKNNHTHAAAAEGSGATTVYSVGPPQSTATVDEQRDHTHELFIEGAGDEAAYTLGPPRGQLQARVPIYGKLSFKDKTGKPKEKGINVGDEWTYRSFIEGRTDARATWTFENLREEMFPEAEFPAGIPVEMTIEVFRTHKGNQEKGVTGSVWLGNPETGKQVMLRNFVAKKFATDVQMIPRRFVTAGAGDKAEVIDLFRDMVSSDGRLEIGLQCLEYGQYYGMAQPDMYIRAADGAFALNFVKCYVGIWLQMVLVLSLGVMFSTFLSGPVALLATAFAIVTGLFSGYLIELASGKMIGGGSFESAQRLMTGDNMINDLEPGFKTNTIKVMDNAEAVVLRYFSAVVPEFSENFFGRHLAFGFDVGGNLMGRCLLRELAYLLPVLILGYLCLKQREVAR